jgi:hypothetical protein
LKVNFSKSSYLYECVIHPSRIFFHKTDETSLKFFGRRVAIGNWSEPKPFHFPTLVLEPYQHQDDVAPQHYFKVLILLEFAFRNQAAGAVLLEPSDGAERRSWAYGARPPEPGTGTGEP